MNGERASQIWTAIALRAQREGMPLSPRHACLACVEALFFCGAGLVLTESLMSFEPDYVTDSNANEVEELQVTLGQGPGIDALRSGMPVLAADLASSTSTRRWPMFAPDAHRLGVGAMFSLPLALGAIGVGVLDLYNDTARHLSDEQLVDAVIYADTALLLVLDAHSGITRSMDGEHFDGSGPVLWRAEVHQAAHMVSAQLGISMLDALVRLHTYAHRHDQRLTDVARSVVERRLGFRRELAAPAMDHDRRGSDD